MLFERGSRQSPEVRLQILSECEDSPEIHSELQRLWLLEEPAQSFLAEPINPERYLTPRVLLSVDDLIAGRFRILTVLGLGGMGEVYKARDERLQRIVAIKILSSKLAADHAFRRRLETEARSVSSLSHPNICSLHDFGSDADLLYLVMEFVPGETLDARVRRGAFPKEEALSIAVEICNGLQHAHANGLVHRDLKPANIMLSPNGAKILDFGIACRVGESAAPNETGHPNQDKGITAAGDVIGTPDFMSPEQAKGNAVDARSDIYSLGRLLKLLLGESLQSNTPRNASSPFEKVVDRCLEADPALRFHSVEDLKAALLQAAAPRRRSYWAVGAAVIFLAFALLAWYRTFALSNGPDPVLRVLTAYPGTEYFPTLSPDGRSLAFLWNGQEDNYDLYVRPIDSDSPRRLTTHPSPERSPRWSPDGRWIAFERDRKIWRIDPAGSKEIFVADMEQSPTADCDVRLAWTSDAKGIIYPRIPAPGHSISLHEIDLTTNSIRQLSFPPSPGIAHVCPETSPDGLNIVFRSVESGQPKLKLASWSPLSGLSNIRSIHWIDGWSYTWTADGKDLIFSRRTPGAASLFRSNLLKPNNPQRLSIGEEGMYPVVSRQGERLVYMRRHLDMDLWQADLSATKHLNPLPLTRLAASSLPDSSPEFSPDASRLAFYSERGGRQELWVSSTDGKDPIRLAAADARDSPPRWSPDGKYLVYSFNRRIYRIAANGSEAGVPLSPGSSTESAPSYSRDGRWIYFTSHLAGQPDLWRMPAAGGPAQQLTRIGVRFGMESGDAKQLFFVRNEKERSWLYSMPVAGGPVQRIAEVPTRPAQWVVAEGLYFIAAKSMDEYPMLSFFDTRSHQIRVIAQIPKRLRGLGPGLTGTPDRKRILLSIFDLQSDLMLVENFR